MSDYNWGRQHFEVEGEKPCIDVWEPVRIQNGEYFIIGSERGASVDETYINAAGTKTHSWLEIGPPIVHTTIDLHELLVQIHKDCVEWGTLQVPSRTHLTQILAELAEGSK